MTRRYPPPTFAPAGVARDQGLLEELREDVELRSEETREANDVITPWEYLCVRLAAIDSRIVQDNGTIFSATLKDHPKMKQRKKQLLQS